MSRAVGALRNGCVAHNVEADGLPGAFYIGDADDADATPAPACGADWWAMGGMRGACGARELVHDTAQDGGNPPPFQQRFIPVGMALVYGKAVEASGTIDDVKAAFSGKEAEVASMPVGVALDKCFVTDTLVEHARLNEDLMEPVGKFLAVQDEFLVTDALNEHVHVNDDTMGLSLGRGYGQPDSFLVTEVPEEREHLFDDLQIMQDKFLGTVQDKFLVTDALKEHVHLNDDLMGQDKFLVTEALKEHEHLNDDRPTVQDKFLVTDALKEHEHLNDEFLSDPSSDPVKPPNAEMRCRRMLLASTDVSKYRWEWPRRRAACRRGRVAMPGTTHAGDEAMGYLSLDAAIARYDFGTDIVAIAKYGGVDAAKACLLLNYLEGEPEAADIRAKMIKLRIWEYATWNA